MTAQPRKPPAPSTPLLEVVFGAIAVAVFGVTWYFLVGLLHRIQMLEDSKVVTVVQYGGGLFLLFGWVGVTIDELRQAARARRAHQQVANAIGRIQNEMPGINVADMSAEELARTVSNTKVSKEQLVRLVEQHKQKLLIDDDYFRRELSHLIVDYLQPLPRNAKRVLNRFRVNLLIAHRRGLFTSDPPVTTQQIGKWLVLAERWPQLARTLSATPLSMAALEQEAARPAPVRTVPLAAAAPPAPGPPSPSSMPPDPFMETIRLLAPAYAGDEDLRKFIRSVPALAPALPHLVHYGAEPSAAVESTYHPVV